jgi:ABC-type glycerol-3-phosphate transport system substrate-binding protein
MDWLDKSTFGVEGAVDAEPLPLPRHVKEFNVATQDGYFILAKSEHPEEAYQWMRFLLEQESASGKLIPPLHSAIESAAYAARTPPGIVSVAQTLPAQTVIFSLDMLSDQRMGQTIELFSGSAQSVFNDLADPQTALDNAQQQAEALFR